MAGLFVPTEESRGLGHFWQLLIKVWGSVWDPSITVRGCASNKSEGLGSQLAKSGLSTVEALSIKSVRDWGLALSDVLRGGS